MQKVGKSTLSYINTEAAEEQTICFWKLMLHSALTENGEINVS